jgi:acetyl esterase/lipase
MFYNQINIWDDFKGNVQGKATLKIYIPDNSTEINPHQKNKAILICPGGGYEFVSDREGEPVALAFIALGFNVFVLTYGVAPEARHPQPLLDVSRAMCIIRENAEKWHTDAEKIAVCGFSAGGHLAASLGVFWDAKYIQDLLKIPSGFNKPNALILCYPVITSEKDISHRGSFYNLMGDNQSEDVYESMSLEKHISSKTPPAFIWHTFEDDLVPVENSLIFAQNLGKSSIPFELHIFQQGGHGLSLANPRTGNCDALVNDQVSKWFDLCVYWLENNAYK